MEYLEGESLRALLDRCGPLPVARAVRLGVQVCHGLQAAHAQGMIHRDLKPENLFVVHGGGDRGEIVKILDFGIVKLTADHQEPLNKSQAITDSGQLLGTPHYMSPEQALGDGRIDGRTDIYSLGVLLYELLSGQRPHPGDNLTTVLFHLLKQEPIRLEALRSDLPPGLADVVHRAFAFEASARFRDVAALCAALSPYGGSPDPPAAVAPLSAPTLTGSAGTVSNAEIPFRVTSVRRPTVPGRSRGGSRLRRFSLAAVALVLVAGSAAFFRGRTRLAPDGGSSPRLTQRETQFSSPPSATVTGGVLKEADNEPASAPPAQRVRRQAADGSPAVAAVSTRTSTPSTSTQAPRPVSRVPSPPQDTERSTASSVRERLYEP